jgi:hypothetical protein
MDYCDQCRRHLNGALTCAGCGRAAEEPRWNPRPAQDPATAVPPESSGGGAAAYGPYETDDSTSRQDTGVRLPRPPHDGAHSDGARLPGGPGHPGDQHHGNRPAPPGEPGFPDGDFPRDLPDGHVPDGADRPERSEAVSGEPAADLGEVGHAHRRAGRRPRSAPRRARSKRGRRVLVGVFGVVLAAGALSLAQLALDPGGGLGGGPGATVTDSGTSLDYDGDPGASGKPAVPGSQVDATGTGGGEPGGAAAGGTSGASPSASGDAHSPGPGDSESANTATAGVSPGGAGAGGDTGGVTSPTGGQATGPGETTAPGPTGSAVPPPTGTPAAPPPTGGTDPGPTQSHCTHILIWCA